MNEQQEQPAGDNTDIPPLSGSNMDRDSGLRDFVTVYKWRVIKQETPWNVQRFKDNQCQEFWDFATYESAINVASSFNLPVIHEHES